MKLTVASLSQIAKCRNLHKLSLECAVNCDNETLQQIITGCPKLKYLEVAFHLLLTSHSPRAHLVLTSCPPRTHLVLTSYSSFEHLYCFSQQLTTLLNHVRMRPLEYSLQVSGCHKHSGSLTDAAIEPLFNQTHQLQYLNLEFQRGTSNKYSSMSYNNYRHLLL